MFIMPVYYIIISLYGILILGYDIVMSRKIAIVLQIFRIMISGCYTIISIYMAI